MMILPGLAAAAGLGALALASTLGNSASTEGSSSSGYGASAYSSHASSGYNRNSRKLKEKNLKTQTWKQKLSDYGRGRRDVSNVQVQFEEVFQVSFIQGVQKKCAVVSAQLLRLHARRLRHISLKRWDPQSHLEYKKISV